jgi:hypothetical protein
MCMFRCRGTSPICELNKLHCAVDVRGKLRDTCACVCVCVCMYVCVCVCVCVCISTTKPETRSSLIVRACVCNKTSHRKTACISGDKFHGTD